MYYLNTYMTELSMSPVKSYLLGLIVGRGHFFKDSKSIAIEFSHTNEFVSGIAHCPVCGCTGPLSYEELDIGNGSEAMNTWNTMVTGDMSEEEKNEIEKAMLKYCGLDTYAMYAIWKHLMDIIK